MAAMKTLCKKSATSGMLQMTNDWDQPAECGTGQMCWRTMACLRPGWDYKSSKMKCDERCRHYENTPIQIYWKFHYKKTENFQIKILIFFMCLLKT